jgi:hypothetical protein
LIFLSFFSLKKGFDMVTQDPDETVDGSETEEVEETEVEETEVDDDEDEDEDEVTEEP